jgi:hypothetical protein
MSKIDSHSTTAGTLPGEYQKAKPGQSGRHTQAVIIIHGIGEQRPTDTLRSFADAILPEAAQGGEKYFSKPDPLSELFELRKLQDRSQPRTHFFEYNWAYQAEGTNFRHILSWLSTLLLRSPRRQHAERSEGGRSPQTVRDQAKEHSDARSAEAEVPADALAQRAGDERRDARPG